MIRNPYDHPLDPNERHSVRVQTNCDANDANLIRNTTAYKGTLTNVIAHFVRNLSAELRSLGINGYHPEADIILEHLLRPRPMSDATWRSLAPHVSVDSKPPWVLRANPSGQLPDAASRATSVPVSDSPRTGERKQSDAATRKAKSQLN